MRIWNMAINRVNCFLKHQHLYYKKDITRPNRLQFYNIVCKLLRVYNHSLGNRTTIFICLIIRINIFSPNFLLFFHHLLTWHCVIFWSGAMLISTLSMMWTYGAVNSIDNRLMTPINTAQVFVCILARKGYKMTTYLRTYLKSSKITLWLLCI